MSLLLGGLGGNLLLGGLGQSEGVVLSSTHVRLGINAPVTVPQGATAQVCAALFSLTGTFTVSGTPLYRLLTEERGVVLAWQPVSPWTGVTGTSAEIAQFVDTAALAPGSYLVEFKATVFLALNLQEIVVGRIRLKVLS